MITHERSHFQILAECENGYIGICDCCEQMNFAYKNILLTFQHTGLCEFCTWLIECRSNPDYCYNLPHGRNHVYQSPMQNFFLVLSADELNEIERLYNETQLVIEARKLINVKK
jgi:hypothetical protein